MLATRIPQIRSHHSQAGTPSRATDVPHHMSHHSPSRKAPSYGGMLHELFCSFILWFGKGGSATGASAPKTGMLPVGAGRQRADLTAGLGALGLSPHRAADYLALAAGRDADLADLAAAAAAVATGCRGYIVPTLSFRPNQEHLCFGQSGTLQMRVGHFNLSGFCSVLRLVITMLLKY